MRTEVPTPPAEFAMEMMRHLAIAVCVPDGEDSTGRARHRLMTEAEVVARAVRMSELAWQEFKERGWTISLPVPKAPTDNA